MVMRNFIARFFSSIFLCIYNNFADFATSNRSHKIHTDD